MLLEAREKRLRLRFTSVFIKPGDTRRESNVECAFFLAAILFTVQRFSELCRGEHDERRDI